jgi:hexosaminidase
LRLIISLLFIALSFHCFSQQTSLNLIPYPQEIKQLDSHFDFNEPVTIVLDKNASEGDRFTANELKDQLKSEFAQEVSINQKIGKPIRLTKKNAPEKIGNEGYELTITDVSITLKARGDAGLFYGVQTLLQLVKRTSGGLQVAGMEIRDWPSAKMRAMHYDTKHHQDTREYVEDMIRKFARYKVNMLVWEWEDKLAYEQLPEIGAPGAFTIKDVQELTKFARQRHIELVPLVQGLGHASFILKWPQHAGAREIYASNFEFCPLKDSTYKILFSLWDEAIKATPGSEYIHIGSDETYELGVCSRCRKKAEEIGVSGLYHLFIDKSATYLEKKGRKIMAWEAPMNWTQGKNANKNIVPHKGLVLTESYGFETEDLKYAKQAKSLGYPVLAYDPNPGIEHLFLPYFFKQRDGKKTTGSLEDSYNFLTSTLSKGVFDGVIRTSWDDSGLPMQAWMLQFVAAAAYSWNANAPKLEEFTHSFFRNYFGDAAENLQQLFLLLNEGSCFYSSTLERWVWHEGAIGKTHLPDLPRGDAVEFDPYWNIQYADKVKQAELYLKKMDTALQIGKKNLSLAIKNKYDIEIFNSLAELIRHTAQTYIDLASVENNITMAHKQRFLNHDSVVHYLRNAEQIVQGQINRKNKLHDDIVKLWEQTRLPKGLSTPDKKYLFRQDRTRHYANRTPDLRYLLVDEDDLKLEEYLSKITQYRKDYESAFNQNGKETTLDPWNAK